MEIDRWATTPVTFTNTRWLKPIERFRDFRDQMKVGSDGQNRLCLISDREG